MALCAALALQAVAQQAPSSQQAPPASGARFVVVIDAAHGGDDTGSHLSSGQLEKAANLALSVRLRSLLAARGFQVITTRENDTFVDLDHRAELANHANAAVCLSLHATESGSGVHLFASSLAPANPTRFMPWKTAQAAWETRSLALAGAVNSALDHAGLTVTLGRIPLPGIESMTCPALAVELGPQRDAEKRVTARPDNPDYQTRLPLLSRPPCSNGALIPIARGRASRDPPLSEGPVRHPSHCRSRDGTQALAAS